MYTVFLILQFVELTIILIFSVISVSLLISIVAEFSMYRDFKKISPMLVPFIIATSLATTGVYLLIFFDNVRTNSPEHQALIAIQQQEEARRLSAPVDIRPWGCIPGGKCEKSDSEVVALADSESIPEIGLNRVLVKRNSDGIQFTIMLSGTRNVKKGEKVQVVTVSYQISAARAEMLIIGK